MPEIRLDDGQFMGHTLRRTDVEIPDRMFVPIPVTLDEAQQKQTDDTADALRYAVTANQAHARKFYTAQQQQQLQQGLTNSSPVAQTVADWQRQHALNKGQTAPPPKKMSVEEEMMHKMRVQAAALATSPPQPDPQTWMDRIARALKPKPTQIISADFAELEKRVAGMAQVDQHPVTFMSKDPVPYMYGTNMAVDDAVAAIEETYDPLRSAYPHADVTRAVPALRVDAQPTFFLDDTVGRALENSIHAVCDTKHGESLSKDVERMLQAVYRPEGLYQPDAHDRQSQQAYSGSSLPSIFTRQTIELNDDWLLDVRHATGVYRAKGRSWLGVFVMCIATRSSDGGGSAIGMRPLGPPPQDRADYRMNLRGDTMDTLHLDLFVPVEPEIVTEEWGWGEDLNELMRARSANAMRKATEAQAPAAPLLPNSWDAKGMSHKTANEIRKTQTQIDMEAEQLAAQYAKVSRERERARRVLYSYAWKALMLAVMECRQLTVEKK